jgi:hypothetical protein
MLRVGVKCPLRLSNFNQNRILLRRLSKFQNIKKLRSLSP